MQGVSGFVGALPGTSTHYKRIGIGLASVAGVALYYQSPWSALLAGFAAVAAFAVKNVKQTHEAALLVKQAVTQFFKGICDHVRLCIWSPNNPYGSDDPNKVSDADRMDEFINTLQSKHYIELNDRNDMKICQTLQAVIEFTLAVLKETKQIDFIWGVIETPRPSTPLCKKVSHGNIDPSKYIVQESEVVLQSLLKHRGVKIYSIYPDSGNPLRPDELSVYQGNLAQFSETLSDVPLKLSSPDNVNLVYLFSDHVKNMYAFSMRMTGESKCEMWLGSFNAVKNRILELRSSIIQNGGPDFTHGIFGR
jgi:hypothetical protein